MVLVVPNRHLHQLQKALEDDLSLTGELRLLPDRNAELIQSHCVEPTGGFSYRATAAPVLITGGRALCHH